MLQMLNFFFTFPDSFRFVNFKNSYRWPQPPRLSRNYLGWDGGSRGWRSRCPSTLHRPLQRSLGPSQIGTWRYAAPKHIPAFWGSVCHDHDPMIIAFQSTLLQCDALLCEIMLHFETCRQQQRSQHRADHHRQEVHPQRCFLRAAPTPQSALPLKFWDEFCGYTSDLNYRGEICQFFPAV